MLRAYADVLRYPGATSFVSAGFIARIPSAMLPIGVLLVATLTRDSYALGGALIAAITVGYAIGAPALSRLADRRGQQTVIVVAQTIRLASVVAFAWGSGHGWPDGSLVALCLLAGLSQVSAGSMVRARWVFVVRRDPGTASQSAPLRTAFALEGILDESCFVIGPPLVTVLSVGAFPQLGIVVAVVLESLGMLWLAAQRSSQPVVTVRAAGETRDPVVGPAFLIVVASLFVLGGVFGAVEVSTVAFAGWAGSTALAGVIIGVYALGSTSGGVIVGGLRARFALSGQITASSVILAATLMPVPAIGSVVPLTVVLFVAGLAVAPVLISGLSIIEHTTSPSRITEALSWALSSLLIGFSVSSAASGALVEAHGHVAGYLAAAACGLLLAIMTTACHRRLVSAEHASTAAARPAG